MARIQSADGWWMGLHKGVPNLALLGSSGETLVRVVRGTKALGSMGIQRENDISPWPWGFWGQLGGSPKWRSNGQTFGHGPVQEEMALSWPLRVMKRQDVLT